MKQAWMKAADWFPLIVALAMAAVLIGAWAGGAGAGPGVRLLRQAGDSAQYEFAWGAAQSNRAVTYRVEVTAAPWTRIGDATPLLADSLWLPMDSVDVQAAAVVRAYARNKTSVSTPTTFTVEAQTILGPPGAPGVKIISAIGMTFDSISLVGLMGSAPATQVDLGGSARYTGIGWTSSSTGGVSLACGTLVDGRHGWIEVQRNLADPMAWSTVDPPPAGPGLFIPDVGCGWDWQVTDSTVASVVAVDVSTAPVYTVQVAVFFSACAAQLSGPPLCEVLVGAANMAGDPLTDVEVYVQPVEGTGAWGSGDTLSRSCATVAGICGPGRVTEGTEVAVGAAGAVTRRFVAGE